ncbi:hypothetical protein LOAG_12823 [Loa loa]|uniref:Uncharacterized protein n=1 Tax=Loa loa TaxID=7209 RepID=A0A1S0TKJ7_LOALO|nr:hypothetical protein LOAG_12823 [Loa loa]EFO15685.1 hypothetical protein LOAG_12823 [Loa loa]
MWTVCGPHGVQRLLVWEGSKRKHDPALEFVGFYVTLLLTSTHQKPIDNAVFRYYILKLMETIVLLTFPAAKAKCHCDGKLVEQIACFCPRMQMISSDQKVGTTAEFTSLSPSITSRGIAVPEERMTAYRSNFSIASCSWSHWGIWSVCSETCGVGRTIRKRSCPCRSCSLGESTEVEPCELISC